MVIPLMKLIPSLLTHGGRRRRERAFVLFYSTSLVSDAIYPKYIMGHTVVNAPFLYSNPSGE